ncbi:MAG: hypothetical protein D6744_04095 [Planctomycetota bacterium]|nr:MAG: hypothetical protein D6744_04095 [Planctomycetota bacterium]
MEQGLTDRGREMLALIREFERVGGDVADFADRAGVMPQTFQWWRSKLRRYLDRPNHDFVEVVVETPRPESHLRVVVDDVLSVEVSDGFDAGELRRVVEVLREC